MTLQQIVTVAVIATPLVLVGGFTLFLRFWAREEAKAQRRKVSR